MQHANQPQPKRFSRRKFLKAAGITTVTGLVSSTASLAYGFKVEPSWLELTHHTAEISGLPRAFHGYKIAHLTDIHADNIFMKKDRLADIVTKTIELKPDLAVITGDFVTDNFDGVADFLYEALARLQASVPTVAVLGNHDYWTDVVGVRNVLRRANIENIENRVYTLTRDGQHFHVCGLGDIWESQQRMDIVLDALPDDNPAMLLVHEPDYVETTATTRRFALQLSGHSHGGQVNIPLLGPPVKPNMGYIYHTGRYEVGDMLQYTSRGLGMVPPRVRVNCRPELTLHTLAVK